MTTRTRLTAAVAVVGAASLFVSAATSVAAARPSAAPRATSKALIVGTLLPQTGSLAFLGPPEIAGVQLALKQINAAGGVLGKKVILDQADSGDTSTNIASQSTNSLLGKGVSAIIGAASSSVSLSVIDKITGAGVVQFSPANTSPKLTKYPDHGLYFRDAPPDTFQGAVLGQKIFNDGYTKLAVINMQDAYGTALGAQIVANFTGQGGTVTKQVTYDPTTSDFSAEVSAVKTSNPQAVALVGFDETTKVIQEMIAQGIGPTTKHVYLVDGNLSSTAYSSFPAGTMSTGKFAVQGTTPGTLASPAFKKALASVHKGLKDYSYAPESYDALILIALAAEQAKSTKGTAIAKHLTPVSGGGSGASGIKCKTYAACKKLIDKGKNINYQGLSGPIDFNKYGDPSVATMGLYKYTSNTSYVPEHFVTAAVPAP